MLDPARTVVIGASGRMGRMLVQAVDATPELTLCAAVERAESDWVGQDLGICMGGQARGIAVSDDVVSAIASARVVLDFTTPRASVATAELSAQGQAVHVIGTTGFSQTDIEALEAAARHATIIRAGNMSLGVNLLVEITRQVAAALGEDYDIEVIEAHHRRKVDAPSGTALMLGEAAAEGREKSLDQVSDRGRDGLTGPRRAGAIGFHAIRGGDIIGAHDVLFAGPGEEITLTHRASDRALFAKGAIRAALWGLNQGPGHYNMKDVLGFR